MRFLPALIALTILSCDAPDETDHPGCDAPDETDHPHKPSSYELKKAIWDAPTVDALNKLEAKLIAGDSAEGPLDNDKIARVKEQVAERKLVLQDLAKGEARYEVSGKILAAATVADLVKLEDEAARTGTIDDFESRKLILVQKEILALQGTTALAPLAALEKQYIQRDQWHDKSQWEHLHDLVLETKKLIIAANKSTFIDAILLAATPEEFRALRHKIAGDQQLHSSEQAVLLEQVDTSWNSKFSAQYLKKLIGEIKQAAAHGKACDSKEAKECFAELHHAIPFLKGFGSMPRLLGIVRGRLETEFGHCHEQLKELDENIKSIVLARE